MSIIILSERFQFPHPCRVRLIEEIVNHGPLQFQLPHPYRVRYDWNTIPDFNSYIHTGCVSALRRGAAGPSISIPTSTRDASLGQEHPYEHIDISIPASTRDASAFRCKGHRQAAISIPASTRDASGFAVFHKLAVLFISIPTPTQGAICPLHPRPTISIPASIQGAH